MMVHAQPQPQHEAGCILPSLSNVLHAMRSSRQDDVSPEQAQSASAVWSQMQQISSQHASSWGLAGPGSHSQSSGHSGGDSGAPSSPDSPGESVGVDEKPGGQAVHAAPPMDLARDQEAQRGKAPVALPNLIPHAAEASASTQLPGFQYWPGRKWRERRDKKYCGEDISRQSEHLKVAVLGLQKALPTSAAKGTLLSAVRQYVGGEMAPEKFAEMIKSLVDEHNIIVPTGTLKPGGGANGRKRGLEEDEDVCTPRTKAADSRRPGRARDGKRSKNRGSPAGGQSSASTAAKSGKSEVKSEVANGAWEALVSVCSML